MKETQVQSLGWEDRSPGEGNGNPLQYSYSCLESILILPMDRGVWWAAVQGLAELDTT